jgi:predicted RNase H-like HicB family nuclease
MSSWLSGAEASGFDATGFDSAQPSFLELDYWWLSDRESYKMPKTLTAYVEYDRESKLYVGIVPGVRGAHTQAATLDELQENLREVLELCLKESKMQP